METEELIKLVDGIYKNILDKFNPGARQMINAGKAYLKALHGAAAASRLYVEAITKLARQAQQGTWGGSADVGTALMKIVEVYKEIQDQQMNILKAFYVDLLVPLETNLEKDTKVVQSEQKRFLQQHKQRSETYSKAAATMKKQRKKSRANSKGGIAMDKELKNMQVLEEEKTKLDAFCEQSLKNAMTQERRRYGFVLERQCSLAKHYMSYHTQAVAEYQHNIEEWTEVAKTREYLPESVENMFSNRMRQVSFWADEDLYSNPRSPHFDDDRMSITSQLRKTKSMDASCLDIRSIEDVGSPMLLSRAKSEYNLTASNHSIAQDCNNTPSRRPKSIAVPPAPHWDTQLARALYAYLSSGDNQLSFLEGDVIALIGDRNKGWQFGENLRTQQSGWFPLAYTEIMDDTNSSPSHRTSDGRGTSSSTLEPSGTPTSGPKNIGNTSSSTPSVETPAPRMFGDTLHLHRSSTNSKQIRRVIGSNHQHIPPPALPAPIPTPTVPFTKPGGMTQSQSTNFQSQTNSGASSFGERSATMMKTSASSFNFTTPSTGVYSTHPQPAKAVSGATAERPVGVASLPLHLQAKGGKIGGPVGNVSLHSSNDSGFSNDPPPQPEVDYSDDESIANGSQPKPANRKSYNNLRNDDNNNMPKLPPVRQSHSSSNLIDSRYYLSDDQSNTLMRSTTKLSNGDRKGIVKRTKSFWRFGRHNSDNEILEGMALWKHRDLVDVNEKAIEAEKNKTIQKGRERPVVVRHRRPSRDRSNDSDKTLNAKQQYEESKKSGSSGDVTLKSKEQMRHRPSFNEKQKLSLPPRQEYKESKVDSDFDTGFENNSPEVDQFYDDGDGLMLRTVNRKNILQQYSNDSTGSDTDSESIITSDDPYDCIVVDDQTTKKVKKSGADKFPNVAEIGKKLEKLSKNAKYSPDNKESVNNNQFRNSINEKNNNNAAVSLRNERNAEKNINAIVESEKREIIQKYRDAYSDRERHSFATFGHEDSSRNTNGEEPIEKDAYHSQSQDNRTKKQTTNGGKPTPKQRYHPEPNERNNIKQETARGRQNNHEKSNADAENKRTDKRLSAEPRRKMNSGSSERRNAEKLKYYSERIDASGDEYSDTAVVENRQFLPRTKLAKTSTSTMHDSSYEHESGLLDYGESLQNRLKSPDYGSKFDGKSPATGNMYGPWYDLWGLDSSVRK